MSKSRKKRVVEGELREALERAAVLVEELSQLRGRKRTSEELESELEAVRTDRDLLTEQMISAERQAGRIMSLYVATHQLHATLRVEDVYSAIGEIAQDLLGAESFAVIVQDDLEQGWKVGLSRDTDEGAIPLFEGSPYAGGLELIDQSLEDGVLRIQEDERSPVIATVPLRVDNGILGVLAVFKVFTHKSEPLDRDRDLLELLSAHVGSALLAADSYCTADRRLRTLKELVGLLPSS